MGGGVYRAELGDEVRGVFGGVDREGAGDDEKGLSEFADGELFARALGRSQWVARGLGWRDERVASILL